MLPKLEGWTLFLAGYFTGVFAASFVAWWQANKSRVAKSIRHYRETDPAVEPRIR